MIEIPEFKVGDFVECLFVANDAQKTGYSDRVQGGIPRYAANSYDFYAYCELPIIGYQSGRVVCVGHYGIQVQFKLGDWAFPLIRSPYYKPEQWSWPGYLRHVTKETKEQQVIESITQESAGTQKYTHMCTCPDRNFEFAHGFIGCQCGGK